MLVVRPSLGSIIAACRLRISRVRELCFPSSMLVFPIYLLGLIFSPCTCFFFGLFIFVPLQFFPAFSLPDIFFCGLVVPTFGMVLVQDWSYGALPGLAALCLVLRRSAWSCSALPSLSRCRCDCDLICHSESLSSQFMGRAPIV